MSPVNIKKIKMPQWYQWAKLVESLEREKD